MLKPTKQSINGTSLCGYIDISYAELVEHFGEPNSRDDGYKVDACWALNDAGTIVTIYNYKTGPNYLGDAGTPVAEITDWHIGGFKTLQALAAMRKAFPKHNVRGWN